MRRTRVADSLPITPPNGEGLATKNLLQIAAERRYFTADGRPNNPQKSPRQQHLTPFTYGFIVDVNVNVNYNKPHDTSP